MSLLQIAALILLGRANGKCRQDRQDNAGNFVIFIVYVRRTTEMVDHQPEADRDGKSGTRRNMHDGQMSSIQSAMLEFTLRESSSMNEHAIHSVG